ncbi:MAG: glycine/D-amino acid oxidase [Chloroflexota bacterium]|nr:MAG: glycine/D-amino acid oxidase [Chloroflexota bacterium]
MASQRTISNPDAQTMPHTADVVIIGGGPAGTAALWAIERLAPGTKTVLIEQQERLGAGSSTAALECYRTCWPTVCLAEQMQRSIAVFHNADEYLGEGAANAIHLKEQGYLFCAFTEAQAAGLKQDVARLHEIGLTHIEYLEAEEVQYRFGWVGERVIAAKFDPVAGWLDSNALIYRYAQSAPSAKILLGVAQVEIHVEGGCVVGVKIPAGEIRTGAVILAAGANVRAIGRTAKLDLPVTVIPRQSFTTGWRHEPFPEHSPMIISAAPYPHVRPEAKVGAIFGWEYTWNSRRVREMGYDAPLPDAMLEPIYPAHPLKDPRFPSLTLAWMARQFGHAPGTGFANPRYLQGLHHNIGYYVYRSTAAAHRPDGSPYHSERAILDRVPSVEGLFLSIAHGGHGIMTSAGAGEIIASLVLDMPFVNPSAADFGLDVAWVEHDESVL